MTLFTRTQIYATLLLMILFSLLSDSERDFISRQILLIAKGDEDALTRVYKAVGGRLLSVAMGITRNIHLAEDALSESFLRIVKYADKFDGKNGYAWLCTVVKNTARNLLKADLRRQGADIDGFFNLTDGRDRAQMSVDAIAVETALNELSSKERLCIWLKYFNDFTIREIAEETNLSKSTAQDVIKRAEQRLREILADRE